MRAIHGSLVADKHMYLDSRDYNFERERMSRSVMEIPLVSTGEKDISQVKSLA